MKRSHLRGHPIIFLTAEETDYGVEKWVYEDTGEPTVTNWKSRPCGRCGKQQTEEGHDACLGTLPGVNNACCGHGARKESYIQFTNGMEIKGFVVRDPEERAHAV